MKIYILIAVLFITAGNLFAQVTHVVEANGFDYSPSNLTINVGDSVRFEVGSTHPTRQVSKATWDDNGTTLLEGGFDFAGGNGTVGFESAGSYYYVCTAHISSGMKGRITVQEATPVNTIDEDAIRVYPVPLTGNELSIEWKLPVNGAIIQVYGISGALLINQWHEMVHGVSLVDCSQLPAGMYLLKIQSDGEMKEFKFLKQ